MSKNVFSGHTRTPMSSSSSNLASSKQGSTVKTNPFSSSALSRGKAAPTCNFIFINIRKKYFRHRDDKNSFYETRYKCGWFYYD